MLSLLLVVATLSAGVLAHDSVTVPSECHEQCADVVYHWSTCGNGAESDECKSICDGKVEPAYIKCFTCMEGANAPEDQLENVTGAVQHVTDACLELALVSAMPTSSVSTSPSSETGTDAQSSSAVDAHPEETTSANATATATGTATDSATASGNATSTTSSTVTAATTAATSEPAKDNNKNSAQANAPLAVLGGAALALALGVTL